MQVWCDWQLTLCDPHLSALEVRFSRRCAIQIDVYLTLPGQTNTFHILFTPSHHVLLRDGAKASQTGEEKGERRKELRKSIPWRATGAEILWPDALPVANQCSFTGPHSFFYHKQTPDGRYITSFKSGEVVAQSFLQLSLSSTNRNFTQLLTVTSSKTNLNLNYCHISLKYQRMGK